MDRKEVIENLEYLKLCDENDDWTEVMDYAIAELSKTSAATAWRTDAPPRDGTTFLAWCKEDRIRVMAFWNNEIRIIGSGEAVWETGIVAWASINPYDNAI